MDYIESKSFGPSRKKFRITGNRRGLSTPKTALVFLLNSNLMSLGLDLRLCILSDPRQATRNWKPIPWLPIKIRGLVTH